MNDLNKPEFAAALRYKKEVDKAPRLTARGRGELAKRIIEIARNEGVPIMEDKDLASLLALPDIGDEIPPELYKVAAEIFAFLYKINGELKKGKLP